MESTGEPGRIQMSAQTAALVRAEPALGVVYRGRVVAKGKGDVETYWLRGAKRVTGDSSSGGGGNRSAGMAERAGSAALLLRAAAAAAGGASDLELALASVHSLAASTSLGSAASGSGPPWIEAAGRVPRSTSGPRRVSFFGDDTVAPTAELLDAAPGGVIVAIRAEKPADGGTNQGKPPP